MGHPRPNDHHHRSSAKRFSSKSDLTMKHVSDVACIMHPSGNILGVICVVFIRHVAQMRGMAHERGAGMQTRGWHVNKGPACEQGASTQTRGQHMNEEMACE